MHTWCGKKIRRVKNELGKKQKNESSELSTSILAGYQ